jgi:integrase
MSTFQRNGQWGYRVVVRLPNGEKTRISGTAAPLNTKAAATAAEKAHVERLLNPPAAPVERLLFSQFAKDWLKSYPASVDNRPSTVAVATMHVEKHLVPALDGKALSDINAQGIVEVFARLRTTKTSKPVTRGEGPAEASEDEERPTLSPATVRNIGQTLHKILVCAYQWGKLPQGIPVWPKRKVEAQPFDFYTAEESSRLLEAAGEDRALLMFALRTGARAGEQLALEWGDIDFVSHKVHLTRNLHRGIEGPTKTGRGRTLPLSPALEDALRGERHLRGQKVFCQADGKPFELWHLTAKLRRAARRAGLRRLRWHGLRHSFASQSVIMGITLKQIQEWLGHASITMTMRYAHLAPNTDQVRLVAMLDKAAEAK